MLRISLVAIILIFSGGAVSNKCTRIGGTCIDYTTHICKGGYQSRLCPGSSAMRCCKPCGWWCSFMERINSQRDGSCTAVGGICMDKSNYCAGTYKSGKCAGSSSRMCCVKSGSGRNTGSGSTSCGLITYTASNIKGYKKLRIRVDSGFKSSMDKINAYARQCGVTVVVTNAFRRTGAKLSGTVVEPSSRSNHLVGHAIDMNLEIGRTWCNSDCLSGQRNKHAKCFTDKIQGDSVLIWGNYFDDPVHIDDRTNKKRAATWSNLYQNLQKNC